MALSLPDDTRASVSFQPALLATQRRSAPIHGSWTTGQKCEKLPAKKQQSSQRPTANVKPDRIDAVRQGSRAALIVFAKALAPVPTRYGREKV